MMRVKMNRRKVEVKRKIRLRLKMGELKLISDADLCNLLNFAHRNQSDETHESGEKSLDDNRNGTESELCDKKSSDDLTTTTAILDVLSLNDDATQAQQQATNGKGKSGKKNKKKGGKNDEQVSASSDALKA